MDDLTREFSGTPLADFFGKLRGRKPLPPLVPQEESDATLTRAILSSSPEQLLGKTKLENPDLGLAVKSGLLLWNDALEASHRISQAIPNETGSYWHGIMHRREPDYSNAKYWFQRVGDHPCFPAVRDKAIRLLELESSPWAQEALAAIQRKASWDPYRFVDWCEAAEHASAESDIARPILQKVQACEIEVLLRFSAQNA